MSTHDNTLERFGVDIGDDRQQKSPKPVKRFGCSCGRVFVSAEAKSQHQQATGHGIKEGQHGVACRAEALKLVP